MKTRNYQMRVSDNWLENMGRLADQINTSILGAQAAGRGQAAITIYDLVQLAVSSSYDIPAPEGTRAAARIGMGFESEPEALRRVQGELVRQGRAARFAAAYRDRRRSALRIVQGAAA